MKIPEISGIFPGDEGILRVFRGRNRGFEVETGETARGESPEFPEIFEGDVVGYYVWKCKPETSGRCSVLQTVCVDTGNT